LKQVPSVEAHNRSSFSNKEETVKEQMRWLNQALFAFLYNVADKNLIRSDLLEEEG
jgi:hypothetical protein